MVNRYKATLQAQKTAMGEDDPYTLASKTHIISIGVLFILFISPVFGWFLCFYLVLVLRSVHSPVFRTLSIVQCMGFKAAEWCRVMWVVRVVQVVVLGQNNPI